MAPYETNPWGLDDDQVSAVINFMTSEGLLKNAPTGDKRGEVVTKIVSEAVKAWDEGDRKHPVKSVIRLAGFPWDEDEPAMLHPSPSPAPVVQVVVDEDANTGPAASQSFIEALAWAKAKTLPMFSAPPSEHPDIPVDWTNLPDDAVRRLYAKWAAWLAWAQQVQSHAEAEALSAEAAESVVVAKTIASLDKSDPVSGKARSHTALQSEADGHDNVIAARERLSTFKVHARLAKSAREMAQTLCEQLSREMTFRHQTWEREQS